MAVITKNKYSILLPSLLLLLQLVFLYFIKYTNQNLSITEFSFSSLGNVFVLIIFLVMIAGLFIHAFFLRSGFISDSSFGSSEPSLNKKKSISPRSIKIFIFVTFLLLVISFLSTRIKTPLSNVYILYQSVDKLLSGILYTFYLLILLIFLLNIWLKLFGKTNTNFIKGFLNGMLMLIILLVITFFYVNIVGGSSNYWKLNKPDSSKRNIAVVLGAAVWSGNRPSPTLSGRIDEALELLYKGYVQKILLTGSNAPGEMTEAEVAYEYAKSKEADTTLIEIESNTRSTNEQIRFIKDNLEARDDLNDIILISDSYHLPRVLEISKFYNVSVKVAPSKHPLSFEDELYNKVRESVALFIFWCFAL